MAMMSLEGRANLIADMVNRVEFAGEPEARRKAVYEAALFHLRIVHARGFEASSFYAGTPVDQEFADQERR